MRFMQTSKLFTLLPEELVCTPDGMAIDRDGNLILSCPNFADLSMPSCVLKIDKDRNIKKWFDVPRNEYTGEARAMGSSSPRRRPLSGGQRGLDRRAPHGVHRGASSACGSTTRGW